MPVILKSKDDVMAAFIKGDIDHHTVPEIRESIDDAILSKEGLSLLVLDFGDVSFMDSSGVGLVMGRYRIASARGITLRVDNLSERDFKVMKMSGIEKLAKINKKTEKR